MCNRYGYRHPLNALIDEFSEIGPVRWDRLEPNQPLDQIRPTDRAPVIRRTEEGAELAMLRWGLIPSFWTGPAGEWGRFRNARTGRVEKNPFTNARSESISKTSAYQGAYAHGRCLIPATEYFEWTRDPQTPKGRSLMWKFTVPGQPVFAFAGIWDRARTADGVVESFALLTSAPGPDQARYHEREPVVLARTQWAAWLDPANDMARTFKGSAAGSLSVEPFVEA